MVYFYGPAATVALYVGQTFHRTPTSEGLTIGEPLKEPSTYSDARWLVAYEFSGEQVAYARKVIVANVARGLHPDDVTFSDTFPADWRWPVLT